ncbi:DUF3429 family protein [Thioalbus denitrificans]|uniref:Uncharacterized protein DUF3429 n=1 Tax=Thioalbus denitrificans TaxID=547122 RepID=A0A369CHY9_9GAMM|nr:DUF3429 family protein [Thioalbus denitrificans]RCX33171.1 uncharacterized protein DUF3429 [Thioalbus denitrificans]
MNAVMELPERPARLPAWLEGELEQGPEIVVLASAVTDTRLLERHLGSRGLDFRVARLGMGTAERRGRFHELRALTGLETLPQVFMDGRCIGGELEALALDGAKVIPPVEDEVPAAPLVLGAAGLVPFLAAALGPWLALWPAGIEPVFFSLAYAAAILSFLGGVQWGLALPAGTGLWLRMTLAVIPSLVAWAALLAGGATGLLVAGLGLLGVYLADEWLGRRRRLPRHYLVLRRLLTPVALVALAVTGIQPAGL